MRLEVGKIDKPHGVYGDVVVTLLSDRTERLDVGAVLFRDDGFQFTVKKSRPHQHRFIVEFAQISGPHSARSIAAAHDTPSSSSPASSAQRWPRNVMSAGSSAHDVPSRKR